MKDALLFSLLAMFFYAAEIVTTDLKLGSVNPKVLTVLYASGVALLGLVWLFATLLVDQRPIAWPKGQEWGFVALMITASFAAASFHFVALNKHAGAVVMCSLYAMLPVAASVLVYIFAKHELPSLKMVLAWIFAAAAVFLVASEKLQK